ncbi:RidA family protein [Mycolicibacterium sp. CH28]|uniref:RidA family protein n=1 Tax=Mycolicibacterium sp. CH28 TaxID=2512237 RepID=UPI00107FEF97|nr:RidA family protein [Mycolicibacterium sp. CH28]TGD85452.1 RidA family protein [Mycolicibacterium sp. CH28]
MGANTVAGTGGKTVGFYSPAVICPPSASLVLVSGVLSVDRDGATVGAGDFEFQMRTVFRLLGETLAAAGSSFGELAKMTTYLVDPGHIDDFYRIREDIFAELYPQRHPPGNTLLVVARLVRPEFLIEIEGIATTHQPGVTDEFVS